MIGGRARTRKGMLACSPVRAIDHHYLPDMLSDFFFLLFVTANYVEVQE